MAVGWEVSYMCFPCGFCLHKLVKVAVVVDIDAVRSGVLQLRWSRNTWVQFEDGKT